MKSHQPVLSWIEAQLSHGDLKIGDRLPSERALAEQFKLSRASVREAIAVLETLGVVRSAVGSGPQAGTVIVARPGSALGSALRFHVASSFLPVADIVQTRILLETWACQRARADAESLHEAELLLSRMAELGPAQAEEFLGLDARFHLALAESAGNAVVSAIMLSLREAIRDYTSEIVGRLPDWERTSARLQQEHRDILTALQAGQHQLAAQLVGAHIEGFSHEELRQK